MQSFGADSLRNVVAASKEGPAHGFNSLIKSFFTTPSTPPSPPSSDDSDTLDFSSNAAVHLPRRPRHPGRSDIKNQPLDRSHPAIRRRRVSRRWETPPILESKEDGSRSAGSEESDISTSDECSLSDDSSEILDTIYYSTIAGVSRTPPKMSRPRLCRTPKSFTPVIPRAIAVPVLPVVPDAADTDAENSDAQSEPDSDSDSELPNPFADFPSPPGLPEPLPSVSFVPVRPYPASRFFNHGYSRSALNQVKLAWENRRKAWERHEDELAQQTTDAENNSAYSAIASPELDQSNSSPSILKTPAYTVPALERDIQGEQDSEEPSPLMFPRMGSFSPLRDEDLRRAVISFDRTFGNFPLSQIRRILYVSDMTSRLDLQHEKKERKAREIVSESSRGGVSPDEEAEGKSFVSIDLTANPNTSSDSSNVDSDPTPIGTPQHGLLADVSGAGKNAKEMPWEIDGDSLEWEHNWRVRWNTFSSIIRESSTMLEDYNLDTTVHPTSSLNMPILARQLEHPYVSFLFPEEVIRQNEQRYTIPEEFSDSDPDTSFVMEHEDEPTRPGTPALGRRPKFFLGRDGGGGSDDEEDFGFDEDDDEEEDYGELVVDSRALFARPVKVEIIEVNLDDGSVSEV